MMTLSRDGTKLLSPWAESDRNLMKGDERGSGRFMNLSESDKLYIQKQIDKYRYNTEALKLASSELAAKLFQAYRENCLWRIVSCAELFGAELDPTGKLTDDQWNRAIDFVEQLQGGQR